MQSVTMVLLRRYHGGTTGLPQRYHSVTMDVPLCYHGGTTVLPWRYLDVTTVLPQRYHGGTTLASLLLLMGSVTVMQRERVYYIICK